MSKREYKSHVGITETLKLLIAQAATPKSVVLKTIEENAKVGKLNPKVVKKLFKVVIDDTLYEISCIYDYTKYLDEQIRRLETINDFSMKMMNCKNDKKKDYYKEGMEVLFEGKEDFRNYKYVLEEYRTAYVRRKEVIDNLFDEIKLIKKLRV